MKINIKKLVIAIVIPLAVGAISGFLTNSSMEHYAQLEKPPLNPPGIVFPFVWAVLFTLMGISTYMIAQADVFRKEKKDVLSIYGVQLFVNFFWSIIFFNMRTYLFAFIWLLILLALIIIMIRAFYKISSTAAFLQIPYLIWVIYAGYLNLGVYLLNR